MKQMDSLQVSGGKGFALCCIAAAGKAVDVIIRYYSGRLVDHGISGDTLTAAMAGIIAICGINLLLQYLGPYAGDKHESSYTGALFSGLENKILSSEQEQIDKRSIGEFSTCISSDIYGILRNVKRMLQVFFPDIISFALCAVLIASMKLTLGLAALVSALVSAFCMTKLSKGMIKSLRDYQDKLKSINGLTSDGLFNLEMVKVNMMEKDLSKQYQEELEQLHKLKKKANLRQACISMPTMILSFATLITIAFCGGYFVLEGRMSVGQLLAAVTLSDYIVSPIMRLENTLVQYRRAAVNLKNYSLFEEMEQEKETVPGVKADTECGIRDLHFHYPDGREVFDGLDLGFEKGKINYIVGENGSGKSTLMKIIGGCYGIDGGEIRLPVKSGDRSSIRESVSIMPQESLVFADSIKANLLAGTSCPEEKMYGMCEAFGLNDEIRNMEKGYDTILKEKGAPLSGGQKKRIAFIRSILRDASVYVFDEPTVNVDRENSIRMMEAISGLAEQHYVLMITHDREMMDRYPGVVHDMTPKEGV